MGRTRFVVDKKIIIKKPLFTAHKTCYHFVVFFFASVLIVTHINVFFDWLQALNVESSTLDKRIYAHFNFNLNYKNKETKYIKSY